MSALALTLADQMEVFVKGWLVTLTDGRRFSWSEADGVQSAAQALAWTLINATWPAYTGSTSTLRPSAAYMIESIREETVLVVVPLSEN